MKRMRRSTAAALAMALVLSLSSTLMAAQQKSADMKLKVGDMAPDFKLQYFDGSDLKDVKLSDFQGKKNVVLAFYIFAFTGG